MDGKDLQRSVKGKIWIVATIWENIIIVGIISGVSLFIIALLFRRFIVQIFATTIGKIFLQLAGLFISIYAIKLGVKSVLKKTSVDPQDIVKISVGVAIVPLFFQVIIILYRYFHVIAMGPGIIEFLKFIFSDVIFFAITYFWFKVLTK